MKEEILDLNNTIKEDNIIEGINKYLPIGSIVLLKEGNKRIMITGYLVGEDNNNNNKVYDYCGCYYPEGNLDSNAAFVFNHEQIKEIFHLGYIDIESIQFRKALSKIDKEHIKELI